MLCMLFITASMAMAQAQKPVKWNFSATPLNEKEAELIFAATLPKGWHIYSQHLEPDGPMPTTFTFTESKEYKRIGAVEEKSTPFKEHLEVFEMDVVWYKDTAVFTQKIKLAVPSATVKGKIEFMICDDSACYPDAVSFSIAVTKPEKSKAGG